MPSSDWRYSTTIGAYLFECPQYERDCRTRKSESSSSQKLNRVVLRTALAMTVLVIVGKAVPVAADTLVSNIGQTTGLGDNTLQTADRAQRFTTGAHPSGYLLTSIELRLKTGTTTTTPTVAVFSGSANGVEVEALSGPSSLDASATKNYSFVASGTIALQPSTNYWVVAEGGTTDLQWRGTSSASEDTHRASGWSINDTGEWRTSTSVGSFAASTGALMIRVNGSVKRDTTAPAFQAAHVDGKELMMIFDERLHVQTENVDKNAFTVNAGGSVHPLVAKSNTEDPVIHEGSTVTLTLVDAVGMKDSVTVSYDPTLSTNAKIRDLSGNPASSFSNLEVENLGNWNGAAVMHLEVEEGSSTTFSLTPPGTPTPESPVEFRIFHWSLEHVTVNTYTQTATNSDPVTFRVSGNSDSDWQNDTDFIWVAKRGDGSVHFRRSMYVNITVLDDDAVAPGETGGCTGATSSAFWSTCLLVGLDDGFHGFEGRHPGSVNSNTGALTNPKINYNGIHEIDGVIYETGKVRRATSISFVSDPRPVANSWIMLMGDKVFSFSDAASYLEPRPGSTRPWHTHSYRWPIGGLAWSEGQKVTLALIDVPKPTDVVATPGDQQVTLSWVAPPGITVEGYEVRICEGTIAECPEYKPTYSLPPAVDYLSTNSTATSWTTTKHNDSTCCGDLENGVTYTAQVRALVDLPASVHARGGWSDRLEFVPQGNLQVLQPPAPTITTITTGGLNATVYWETPEAVEGISGWQLRYGELDRATFSVDWGDWADLDGATADTRSYTVSGLSQQKDYGIQLRVMVGRIEGAPSSTNYISGVLHAVTGFTATPNDGSVRLSWAEQTYANDVHAWQVRWKEVSSDTFSAWTAIEDSDATTTEHTVSELVNQTQYAFQIRAIEINNAKLAQSAIVTAYAGGAPPPSPPDLHVEGDDGRVKLTWTVPASVEPITGWQLRYGYTNGTDSEPNWGAWTDIEAATGQTTTHTVNDLSNGTEYAFELRAMAGELEGETSVRRMATPDEIPIPQIDFIEGLNVTSTTVDLRWTLPDGVTPTRLFVTQRLIEEDWLEIASLDLDATSYPVTGLTPATRYQFRVVLETEEQRAESGLVQIDTLANDPLNVQMTGTLRDGNCPAEVTVAFWDESGEFVAVDALSTSDFTVANGRVNAPIAAGDGLSWTTSATPSPGFSGLMRVQLRETEDWHSDEQVFRVKGDGTCDAVPRTALAELQIEGAVLEPAFEFDTLSYQIAVPAEAINSELRAVAAYQSATVSISSPSDADEHTPGHQVTLADNLAVTVDVTADKQSSRYVINGYAAPVEKLTRFVLVDASTDTDLGAIEDDSTLSVSSEGTYGIRVEVEEDAVVGSVVLVLTGPSAQDTHTQTESYLPYSLYGDNQGAEHGRALAAGPYTLSATAYSSKHAVGDILSTLTVEFRVTTALSAALQEPLAATNLATREVTSDTLELAWSLPDQPKGVSVSDVVVQREVSGTWRTDTTLLSDSTSYTVTGLTPSTSYRFRIRTVTSAGTADSEPVQANTLAEPVLTGFTLLDSSDQSIVMTLSDGVEVDLGARFEGNFGIRADVTDDEVIGSVVFALSGAKSVSQTENIPPYSLYGDTNTGANSALIGKGLPAGVYTLSATVYDAHRATGNVLDSLTISFRVLARVSLSVKDARAVEGTDTNIPFVVALSRKADAAVTVEYETTDVTATAGVDYSATSGTLSFAAGETSKTVSVAIVNDDHDEGEETFTFTLSNPSGAGAYLSNSSATGFIENSDPMPKAWLARFGRATSDNIVTAISRRWDRTTARPHESHFTVRGQRIRAAFGRLKRSTDTTVESFETKQAMASHANGRVRGPLESQEGPIRETQVFTQDRYTADSLDINSAHDNLLMSNAVSGLAQDYPTGTSSDLKYQVGILATAAGDATWAELYREGIALSNSGEGFDFRDLLANSSFYYASAEKDENSATGWFDGWALWGESSFTRFGGAEGDLGIDGEATSTLVGVDRAIGSALTGVAVAYTEGAGAYFNTHTGTGKLKGSLTNLNPYTHWQINERTSTWGLLGYGEGTLELTSHLDSSMETAMSYSMAAIGGRTELATVHGESRTFEFALTSDARFSQATSDTVPGLMGATGETHRFRLMIETDSSLPWGGGSLTPKLDTGLRYDGGDAETGVGLEINAGFGYAFDAVHVALDARVLAAHQDRSYKEWGANVSFVYEPSIEGRGLSLTLGSNWGVDPHGVMSLWSQPNASGLVPNEPRIYAARRIHGRLGYGFEARNSSTLWTPYIAIRDVEHSRIGLQLATDSNLKIDIEIGSDLHAIRPASSGHGYSYADSTNASTPAESQSLPAEVFEHVAQDSRDHAVRHALVVNWSLYW